MLRCIASASRRHNTLLVRVKTRLLREAAAPEHKAIQLWRQRAQSLAALTISPRVSPYTN